MTVKLKEEVINLLKEDLEFRYAVAGLIGLEEVLKRLDKHEAQLVKLREDMLKGFQRHDEEIAKLREDMVKGFERHDEEFARLREDMRRGFELLERHVSALGARWGLLSEEAFREGLKGLLEKELGLRVERWSGFDQQGYVYGYPSPLEIDVAVVDGKTILVEVSSHVRPSDVAAFKRKAEAYEKATGRRPERLMIITPYAEDKAKEACLKQGVEIYTKI
ncbi:MAG: DUF3782 domain-containing protein [Candidatus Bathyarchaeia archaeon]